jgi:RNA polymerase sigma factor (sigma-70 family)
MLSIQERRQRIKLLLPIKYFYEKSFDTNNRNQILKDIPLEGLNESHIFKCGPKLSKEQEFHLFRKYNYLKHRLHKLTSVNINRIGDKTLCEIESLINKIEYTRNVIFKCNTKLVVRPVTKYYDQDTFDGDDFISNAFLYLIKAIDCFDYTRGFKFSTYCTHAIKNNTLRDKIKKQDFDKKFTLPEKDDEKFEPEDFKNTYDQINHEYNKSFIRSLLEELKSDPKSNKKIFIIESFYGLEGHKHLLPKDIAKKMGLSRETIRQIKSKTLKMLRKTNLVYDPIV